MAKKHPRIVDCYGNTVEKGDRLVRGAFDEAKVTDITGTGVVMLYVIGASGRARVGLAAEQFRRSGWCMPGFNNVVEGSRSRT